MNLKQLSVVFFMVLLGGMFVVPATSLMVEIPFENLTLDCDEIIIGTVTDTQTQWTDGVNSSIMTISQVRADQILKGNITQNTSVSVYSQGGTVNATHIWVEDEPVLQVGQVYGMFLKETGKPGDYRVFGNFQGVVELENISEEESGNLDPRTSPEKFVVRVNQVLDPENASPFLEFNIYSRAELMNSQSSSIPVIYSITPSVASAGTDTPVVISGKGFGTKSSRQSPADVIFFFQQQMLWGGYYGIYASGYPDYENNQDSIVSWTDSQIIVKVPQGWVYNGASLYQGSAGSGPVVVRTDQGILSDNKPFAVTFGYGNARWPGDNPKVEYYLNVPDYGYTLAITRAANSWNSVSGINFQFNYKGGTNTQLCERNGKNEIVFGYVGDSSTLARAMTWTDLYPEPYGHIQETDIQFNNEVLWDTTSPSSDEYDVETVALHELGHWLKLTDLYGNLASYPPDSYKVMYGFSNMGEIKRTLSAEDISGIEYIYPKSAKTTGSLDIISTPTGAKIYVDNADTDFITPKTISNLATGNHTIKCSLTGYDDASQIVNVTTGQTVTVQMVLNKTVVIPPGTDYKYVSMLGTSGSGNGQFYRPFGVAVDEARNRVYVADTWNHRIQAFDRNGNFITKWGSPGEFIYPFGIAVDKETGYIYTAEQLGNRVQVFSSDGIFIRKWGSSGTGNGQFNWSDCIAVDGARDRVYVTDTRNNRVQIFDRSGNFISKFGSFGSGNGQIKTPYGIAVNPINGYIYVCDPGNSRIQVFDFNGNYQKQFGTRGTGIGQFLDPLGVDIDDTGRVFVAETVNGRIQVFTSSGEYITHWCTFGTGNGQLNMPYDVAVNDINGYVYVADTENSRVQVFAPTTSSQIPPASITSLQNTTFQPTSITWTWTDPTSTDFSKVMVYLDGVFKANITKGVRTYTASPLTPGTQHTIATRTVGATGLINQTWVNVTTSTAPDSPSFGSAFIQSTPTGAKIYIDSADTGFVTPKTISHLASGSHIIRCSLSGYDDTAQTVTISSGQTTSVMITLQQSGNVAPKADFSASPREGESPLTVRFSDKSTSSPTSWSWSFGDGGTSTEQNPSHTYLKQGIYSVKLKVSNNAGTNGLSKSGYIVVSDSGPTPTIIPTTLPTTVPTTIITYIPTTPPTTIPTTIITTIPTTTVTTVQTTVIPAAAPKADFLAPVRVGISPLTVQFSDKSTNSPTSWIWTFGDGTTSSEQNPIHIYTKPGIYSVKLKVQNAEGSAGLSKSGYIVVS